MVPPQILAVVLVSLLAGPAGGDAPAPEPSWLLWTRGAGAKSCVDAVGFAAQVRAQLGPDAVRAADTGPRVAVSIDRSRSVGGAAQWSADLHLVTADGTPSGNRHLEQSGDSCEVLTEGLALVVALLLAGDDQPGGNPASRPPPPAPTVVATAAPVTARMTAPARAATSSNQSGAAAERRSTSLVAHGTLAIEGGPSVGVGALPGVSAAGEVRLWATPRRGPGLFATGTLWRSRRAQVAGGDSGADLDLWTAGIGLCPQALRAGVRAASLAACLTADVGRLGVSGFGFGQAFGERHWTADAGVEIGLRQPLGERFFLASGLRVVIPLTRHNIIYSDGATTFSVFRVAPMVVIAGLRVGAVIP